MKRVTVFCLLLMMVSGAHAFMDAQELQPDSYRYMCPKDDKEALMVFACFKDRQILESTSQVDRAVHRALLDQDLTTVCKCLEKDNFISKEMLKGRTPVDSLIDNVFANIHSVRNRIEARKNMLVIQSNLIATNEDELNKFNAVYSPSDISEEVTSLLDEIKRNLPTEVAQQVKSRFNQDVSRDRLDYLQKAVSSISYENSGDSARKLASVNNNSCLPMQMFFHMTQLPQEKEFYSQLQAAKEGGFVQEDWNYESLGKKLRQMQQQIQKEKNREKYQRLESEMRGIKGKLKFLAKNPIFKYTFSSTDGGTILYIGTGATTRQKQLELFKVMTDTLLSKDNSCAKVDGDCAGEVTSSPRFQQFRDLSKKIAQDPEVIRIVKRETSREMKKDLADLTRRRNWFSDRIPLDVNILNMRVQYATNVNIRDCKSGQMDAESCVKGFATYCPMLRAIEGKIKEDDPPSFDDELMSEIDFDLDRNHRYRELSNQICNAPRMKKSDDYMNQVTFYDYYLSKCDNGKSTEPVCKDSERHQLIAQFHTEYPHVSSSDGSEGTGSSAHQLTRLVQGAAQATRSMNAGAIHQNIKKVSIDEAVELAGHIFKAGADIANSVQASEVAPVASEGTGFGSFMKDLATSMKESGPGAVGPEGDFVPYVGPQTGVTPQESSQALTDTQRLRDDAQKERDKIDDEIAEAKKRLASATEDAAKSSLENRIKMLEQLLAQKDKTVAEYQQLFDKLSRERAQEEGQEKTQGSRQQLAKGSRVQGQNTVAQSELPDFSGVAAQRGPASVSDKPMTTSGAASGSSAAAAIGGRTGSSSGAMGARSLNEALLSKYGISVQGSTEGSILVASDKEARSLPALTASTDKSVPLDVPRSQFEKFKSNDLETLREIYEEKLKTLSGNIVKIQVTTQGEKESLEFYAIKEGDKIIFQPVRKAKLNDLKLTLPST